MHFTAAAAATFVLAGLAAALPTTTSNSDSNAPAAILQFEIDADTFTSNTVAVLGQETEIDTAIIKATIASFQNVDADDQADVKCQAYSNGYRVGQPFDAAVFTEFSKNDEPVLIDSILCQ
ncbi:hypothetical protein BDY21DRAFT_374409 [Lineolata rhizophorae]|uniref:Deuterolysin n=1 Tax=Lineolata rhizophorae TaxID=578093 RepID=A0A6A6NR37_9PEZI|nr:hypothetical protein BDY21DRAFT_374409 [Lineolata rhizophorae]